MKAAAGLLFALMAASALPALAQDRGAPLDDTAERRVIGEVAGLMRRNYVDPDTGAQAADRLAAQFAAGAYAGLRSPKALAVRLTRDLRDITRDQHVEVIATAEDSVPAPARSNGGFVRVDRLKGNIGYMRVDQFPPLGLFTPFANEAMAKAAGVDALIVDLRGNIGGAAASVVYFASFFFGQPTHVGDFVVRTPGDRAFTTQALTTVATPATFAKPVYVLTSARTFSGGEEFADHLQAQGRAKVVGEPTAGGANAGASWPLMGGQLQAFVPSSRAQNPVTKTNWADSGVKPDLAAPEADALAVAMRAIGAQADIRPRATPDQLVEARLFPLRTQAQPGGEAAVRKLLADFAAGNPDYAHMSVHLANVARAMAANLQADLARLGPIRSVAFQDVGPVGGDEYIVRFANGAAIVMIYREPDGGLDAFGFYTG